MCNWSETCGYYIDYWRSWFYRFNASELFGKRKQNRSSRRFINGKKENLDMDKQVTFIEGDVSDSQLMERIMKEYQFAYIFHLAAVASVADSVERPVETHRVNFDSALLLLEFARKYQSNLKRLVFSSSAAVYGDEPTLPKKRRISHPSINTICYR